KAWPPERIVTSACSTTLSWPNMTVPIAAFASRTCAAVDSAARTIISSIFSRPSPPALGMANSLLLGLASDQIRGRGSTNDTTPLYAVSRYKMQHMSHLHGADFALIR